MRVINGMTSQVSRALLLSTLTGVLLASCLFFLPHEALAQAEPQGSSGGPLEWFLGATVGAVLAPVALVSFAIFAIAKALLWVAGIVLNFSVLYLVFEFSTHLGTSPGMLIGWSVLRDFGNILLLFGFLMIGFKQILNVGNFSAGKALPKLILYAILLNFSLFVAAAVVDISNGITVALFSQTAGYNCEGSAEQCLNDGITGQIAQQADLISIGTSEGIDFTAQVQAYTSQPIEYILKFLLSAVLVSIMTAVLFAAGFLLISRGITLAFLLITSPIGFAGMVIDPLQDMAKKWWKALIDNALFAPVFMVLLFIALRMTDGLAAVMGGAGGLTGPGGLANAIASGDTIEAGPIFFFVLVVGFMIAALKVGKQFSIMGAEQAIGVATRLAGSPYVPARDWIGRKSEQYGKAYERNVAGKLRNIPIIGGALGKPLDEAIQKSFNSGKNVSVPGWGSYADDKKRIDARDKQVRHAEHEAHVQHEFDEAIASYGTDPGKLKKFLQQNDLKSLEKREFLNKKNIAIVAEAAGADSFKKFMESDDGDEAFKHEAHEARKASVQKKLDEALRENTNGNPDKLVKFMKDVNGYDVKDTKQLASGGPELETMVRSMSVDTFKKFNEDKEIPESLRKKADAARKDSIQREFDSAIAAANGGNPEALEKLSRETDNYDLARTRQATAGGSELETLAGSMSPEGFKNFYSNKDIATPIKERYKAARYKELITQTLPNAANGTPTAIKKIRETSDADIVMSGVLDDATKRQQLVRSVSEKQYVKLRSNRALGDAARNAMEQIRYGTGLGSRFETPDSSKLAIKNFESKKEINNIPASVLIQDQVLNALSPAHFFEIANAGRVEGEEKNKIRDFILEKIKSDDDSWVSYIPIAPKKQLRKLNDFFGTNFS